MTTINPLRASALKTIAFLTKANLITDEHAATIGLLEALTDEYTNATNSTQRAAISKEIRACIEALPKPQVKVSDDAADFLASLENV